MPRPFATKLVGLLGIVERGLILGLELATQLGGQRRTDRRRRALGHRHLRRVGRVGRAAHRIKLLSYELAGP